MNILLDTHVALWVITDDPKLSQANKDILLSPRNIIWVSVVSLWEIAIKHHKHQAVMPLSGKEALQYFTDSQMNILSVEPEHIMTLEELADHHADPFDRLLVAQALSEPMRLMTHDKAIAQYSDTVISI
ncbi:MAG: type II toxin-antitoxin system VapC family toxin [Neisseria sp.]|nr:type II toxin-antitoxin system VapC family toxin [Neisseria sp.]